MVSAKPAQREQCMSESARIDAVVGGATRRLSAVSDSPRLDAEILLGLSIDMPRSYLFAHPEDTLDEAASARLNGLIERRLSGEPMAYITGIREFWSLELMVSPATLVPRPETELLVDLALREIPRDAEWQILDLGTGSGAIAVAIAKERPLCDVTAVDMSAAALRVAQANVRQLSLGNVTCIEGDWAQPVAGQQFDIIVSNPPYVRADDAALDALTSEPVAALVGGDDGLDAIRVLARDCREILCADGVLLLEHGADQQQDVATLLQTQDWTGIVCHTDLAGLPRVSVARMAQ
jgi:release factor glutamine methyltransferase